MSDASAIPNPTARSAWPPEPQALRENVSVRPGSSRQEPTTGNPANAASAASAADPAGAAGAVDRARTIRRLSRLAFILDTAVTIPGTKVRVGLDPVLGLVPVAGDAISAVLSLYIIVEAARLGATKKILGLMLLNVAADFVVGSIPLAGDVADVLMKANVRNLKLMNIEPRW